MKFFLLLLTTLAWLLMFSSSVTGDAAVAKSITVDQSGIGDYFSIQKAIDSIPDNNNQWIKIHVNPGIYKYKIVYPFSLHITCINQIIPPFLININYVYDSEKVVIGPKKTYILLEGNGAKDTFIQWDDHVETPLLIQGQRDLKSTNTRDTATVTVLASNFVARDITFKNAYDQFGRIRQSQALALLLNGDKMSFYRCGFIGFQDTLCDLQGRHYFNDCLIQGSVDFIFGYAQSIYEDCHLVTVGNEHNVPGYLTAHGRAKPDTSGFVFKSCSITGTRKAFLGRAWGPFARVLFYNTDMANIVVQQGWVAWKAAANPDQTTFAESKCSGPGSDTSGRVQWEKNLSDEEWSTYISDSFIDSEGWRRQQPQ